jgi:hypothetical protein
MLSNSLGLIEMILVFGIVLAAAAWELLSLRKAQRRAREESGKGAGEVSQTNLPDRRSSTAKSSAQR